MQKEADNSPFHTKEKTEKQKPAILCGFYHSFQFRQTFILRSCNGKTGKMF